MLYRLRALLAGSLAAVILLAWAAPIEGAHRSEESIKQTRAEIVQVAKRQIGRPYVWGASGPRYFDCSGLVRYVYRRAVGIWLPHNAAAQYYSTRRVVRLRRGDLVFFHSLGHVGIYIGKHRFIHAPHSGSQVRIDHLGGYYSTGRVLPR